MYKTVILLFIWIDYFWEQYLRARQYQRAIHTREVPTELKDIMPSKVFKDSRSYFLQSKRFAFVKDLFSVTFSTTVILYEILPKVWTHSESLNQLGGGEILTSCIWLLSFTLLSTTINLPLTLYEVFVVEGNNPLRNNQLPWERFKTFVLSQIVVVLFACLIIVTIKQGDHVFVGMWLTVFFMVFIVGATYPLMGPSSFRQQTPLQKRDLRTEIFKLSAELQLPLHQIYVEERYDRVPNERVHICGSPGKKLLVLNNSLFPQENEEGCTNDSILALVALELAKWYHSHSIKYVLLLDTNLLLSFWAFFYCFKNPQIYKAFGFREYQPVLVGVYVAVRYVMSLYSTVINFGFMYMSRRFVCQQDQFVASLGRGEALVKALLHLEKTNVTFPVYDHLYSLWHHDKPPLLERVAEIKAAKQN